MSRPAVSTIGLTRVKLAEVLGQRPEQIRAFEAMFSDVSSVLPDAVEAAAIAAAAAEVSAAAAVADAAVAVADAAAALAVSSGLDARVDVLEAQQPGHAIEDEGLPLAQRGVLNFEGAGVTVTDAGGKTLVTIPGSGSALTFEDEGTPLTQRSNINFVGAGVTVADSGGKTVVTIPGGGGGGGGSNSYFPSGW